MPDPLARFLPTHKTVRGSVLDRLVDADPARASDMPRPIGEQMAELRENLRRDLEALMNTRCRHLSPPPGLETSLLGYGIDTLHEQALVTVEQRARLAAALERSICTHEPRFQTISVEVAPPRHPSERALRLKIRATCVVDIDLPPVLFETELDPATQQFSVGEARG